MLAEGNGHLQTLCIDHTTPLQLSLATAGLALLLRETTKTWCYNDSAWKFNLCADPRCFVQCGMELPNKGSLVNNSDVSMNNFTKISGVPLFQQEIKPPNAFFGK